MSSGIKLSVNPKKIIGVFNNILPLIEKYFSNQKIKLFTCQPKDEKSGVGAATYDRANLSLLREMSHLSKSCGAFVEWCYRPSDVVDSPYKYTKFRQLQVLVPHSLLIEGNLDDSRTNLNEEMISPEYITNTKVRGDNLIISLAVGLLNFLEKESDINIKVWSLKHLYGNKTSLWSSPTIESSGNGYELYVDGLEIAQITNITKFYSSKISGFWEISIGLDRFLALLISRYTGCSNLVQLMREYADASCKFNFEKVNLSVEDYIKSVYQEIESGKSFSYSDILKVNRVYNELSGLENIDVKKKNIHFHTLKKVMKNSDFYSDTLEEIKSISNRLESHTNTELSLAAKEKVVYDICKLDELNGNFDLFKILVGMSISKDLIFSENDETLSASLIVYEPISLYYMKDHLTKIILQDIKYKLNSLKKIAASFVQSNNLYDRVGNIDDLLSCNDIFDCGDQSEYVYTIYMILYGGNVQRDMVFYILSLRALKVINYASKYGFKLSGKSDIAGVKKHVNLVLASLYCDQKKEIFLNFVESFPSITKTTVEENILIYRVYSSNKNLIHKLWSKGIEVKIKDLF